MSDDFDDLPIEQEADDFQNFDPDKYIRRRQATGHSYTEDFDSQSQHDADPTLQSERRRRGQRDLADDLRGRPRSGARRGQRSVAYDDEIHSGAATGVGAGLIGLFTSLFGPSGENIGLLRQLVPAFKPFGRWVFLALGCIVVALCGLACTGAFFIYSLFNTPR